MPRATSIVITLIAVFVISCPALAQEGAGAPEILKKVSDVYTNLKSYHFEGVETEEVKSEELKVKTETRQQRPLLVSATKPDKFRFEIRGRTLNALFVSDGRTIWAYFFKENQYLKKEISKDNKNADKDPLDVTRLAQAADELIAKYKTLAADSKLAKLKGEETVEIAGGKVDCYVVQIDDRAVSDAGFQTRTYWIDKSRYIVLRDEMTSRTAKPSGDFSERKMTTLYTIARVGEPLANEQFAFSPPQGAKEISADGGDSSFIGQPAFAFNLKDTKGKPVELKQLAGKVVLINFWATWCGPCRMEMPAIEKLHRQYKDQGLVVLGINDENPGIADAYLKKNGFTFSTLLDPDDNLHGQYRVDAIPTTVVIGKDGKVIAHLVGARDESEFRSALAKAGIK